MVVMMLCGDRLSSAGIDSGPYFLWDAVYMISLCAYLIRGFFCMVLLWVSAGWGPRVSGILSCFETICDCGSSGTFGPVDIVERAECRWVVVAYRCFRSFRGTWSKSSGRTSLRTTWRRLRWFLTDSSCSLNGLVGLCLGPCTQDCISAG